MKKYAKHFYEEIRKEIAIAQIQHDLRKLFPSLGYDQWKEMDKCIARWFEGEEFELEPVHDFWNFFSGFSRGLKGKSLISWVTAENVNWTKEDIKTDDIYITWDFPGLEFMGKAPYLAKNVARELFLAKNQSILESTKKDSIERSNKYYPRDHFRIILFEDKKGEIINRHSGYYILEGNRRVVRSIVLKQPIIRAYVGRFVNEEDSWPMNYWINTGILRDLIFLSIGFEKAGDEKSFELVRKFYQLLLRDFDLARVATIDKSFKNYETNKKLLYELLMEDLK
jgi:truncated hemoglobin YjbI